MTTFRSFDRNPTAILYHSRRTCPCSICPTGDAVGQNLQWMRPMNMPFDASQIATARSADRIIRQTGARKPFVPQATCLPATTPPDAASSLQAGQIDAIWAELSPRIAALIDARLEIAQQRMDARLLTSLRKKIPYLYAQLAPLIHRAVKYKNDVQDDAIIGIGAKVDAQDDAIQGLLVHVHGILQHPLFRR
jgi:hypothetical protein